MSTVELRHAHLFCGLGGGAKGFNSARPRVNNLQGQWRCIGGVDIDAGAIRDFERATGVRGTVLDLFDRDQYRAFHGAEPPAHWREAGTAEIHRAFGHEHPHVVFLSAPCKGFSSLLSSDKSVTDKYQALNRLTLRGIWLMLEAYKDDPVELVLFENVPRISTRGRHLLDQIRDLLTAYGYAVAETAHDCGEIGGLAQSRKRFLLVARHTQKVPPCVYQPASKPLRAVGDLLGRMPLPGAGQAGPMHRVPRLQWKTWVRLAFVEAGGDWRTLRKLSVRDGVLRDYLIVPTSHEGSGVLGVHPWQGATGAIAGRNGPSNGAYSVADPRFEQSAKWSDGQAYGVIRWDHHSGTITGQQAPGQGTFSVADPRHEGQMFGKYAVTAFDGPAGTVISGSTTGQGAYAVADPRPVQARGLEVDLVGLERPDMARAGMPAADDKLLAVIRALDGTWHRPFTTLELAVLQSLVDPEDTSVPWRLDGESDQAWRERIGNAVPPLAAQAMGEVFGETLLLAMSGESFLLSSRPVWVRPVATAIAVQQQAF